MKAAEFFFQSTYKQNEFSKSSILRAENVFYDSYLTLNPFQCDIQT